MKLLLGASGDDASWTALERTVDRVRETGDDLTVAVVDRGRFDGDPEDVEREVRAFLDDADVGAEVIRLVGDPGARLVDLAEDGDFDRVIVGGGAESPMGKVDLDHFEQYVLLNARTTVTIVR